MNRNQKTVVFILILGLSFSLLLMGVQSLTAERIRLNQEFDVQSAILDAFDESYTIANFNDVFEEVMETIETDDVTLYVHEASGGFAFEFRGLGVWGPISGIIAFETDFETILYIRVLEQEETPGLGGVVAETDYLAKYQGATMSNGGLIVSQTANPEASNEVDAILGATRTSNAFEGMLNAAYEEHKAAWDAYDGGSST